MATGPKQTTSSSSKHQCEDSTIETACKKLRTDESDKVTHVVISNSIDRDGIFLDFPKSLVNALNIALDSLMDETNWTGYVALTPLKILNSNAADCHEGYPFPKAYCCIKKYSTRYSFGSVFRKGLSMLIDFMLHRRMPENKQEKFVLSKLLHYLLNTLDTDSEALEDTEMYTVTEVTSVLTNHLFGKLSTSSVFTIDKQYKDKWGKRGYKKTKPLCPCEKDGCVLSGDFGDTSIGNWMVWHGNTDVIINNQVIVVSPDNEEKDFSPDGNSPLEVKLQRNSQIIAQNIVFSFLQKQRYPESDSFLYPCIGVTGKDIIIYLYDSVHDVLLESTLIPLHGMIPSPVNKINLVAVVVSWLVVNYKYLCDGVMEEMKTLKADFFSQAKSKLDIYETHLKSGEVGNICCKNQLNNCHLNKSEDQVKNLHHPALIDLWNRKKLVGLDPSER